MIILKKISYLLILYIYINLIFGNCTGCNILFNMCNETVDDIDSCNTGDLYILQEIINLNDLNNEIINLGYQEWYNGRLVSFILINNNIYSLPETIGGLSYLVGLDLEFNYISILPESFGDLNNLKYLDLSSNDIESLPDSFFKFDIYEYFLLSKIIFSIFFSNSFEILCPFESKNFNPLYS